MDTDSKLNLLAHIFPDVDKVTLLEILVSCEGSVGKAKRLILGDGIIDDAEEIDTSEKELTPNIAETSNTKVETSTLPEKRKLDNSVEPEGLLSKIVKFQKLNTPLTNRNITLYSKHEIESVLPNIKIFPKFLQKQLADDVLDNMMSQKMLFKAKQFYIAGNLCKSSQKTAVFGDSGGVDYDPVYQDGINKPLKMTPELIKCRMFINDKVNMVLREHYKDSQEMPDFLINENWKSDFCVGNYFPDNKSHLDWHTDKLTNIGPLPTIASISFGATRIFRLRRSSPTNSAIYNIPLPNNTLLIMLPSTQELYKHCVPTLKDSLVKQHSKFGEARFSLTFRMSYPEFEKSKVFCDKCKKQMILRRLFKGDDIGYYVWMCMGSFKGVNCKGFKYAKFDGKTGESDFSTKHRSKATRWLSSLEK
ncbi:hypothetical protein PMKS-002256 [Pichia membranifaciens]|uniref:Fe2OG dioxygenase domain-containing protein n=1 Tax=Pichia membranifaciens TaxID=4926 RepID=A0A1Q2YH22_9ASCO|nr:hypothetical protein PMKS-002256 [Pichia membranifaciens]